MRRDLVAVQLDEPVRERVGRFGRAMRFAVPARIHVGRQAEVGAQIDRVADVVEQAGQEHLALAVRQRAEHEVEAGQVGHFERGEPERFVRGPQARVEVGHRRARIGAPRRVDHLDLGMAGQQAQQLGPGVPGRADHSRSIRHSAYDTSP